MNNLLIINNYLDIFPQRINFTQSIDIGRIESFLNSYSIRTKVVNFNQLNQNPNLAKILNIFTIVALRIPYIKI